ncbi:hypothetical protein GCM10027422_47500 [Hymenobacter arcticus]
MKQDYQKRRPSPLPIIIVGQRLWEEPTGNGRRLGPLAPPDGPRDGQLPGGLLGGDTPALIKRVLGD